MIDNDTNSIKMYVRNGGLTFISCLLTVILLPVHVDFIPPFMILWVVCWILEFRYKTHKISMRDPSILLFTGFALFFLWYLAGLLYTDDRHNGALLVFRRLSFIVFPFVLMFPGELIKKRIRILLKVFCLSTLMYILFSFVLALIRSTYFTNGVVTFNPHPADFDYENYFFGTRFAFSQHPTYVSMYVVFSIFIAFESFFDRKLKPFLRIVWLLLVIVFVISLYFLSSRAGILSALILVPLYLIFQFKKTKKWWASLLIIGIVIFMLIFSFLSNDRLKYYLPEASKTTVIEKLMLDNRVPIWKSAINVIKHNLIIGVGAGDASSELQKVYLHSGYTEAFYNNLNAHNQYLEILLSTGLIGFLIFVSILSFMVYRSILKRNLLFGLFIMTILLFFLFESILNRIAGVTFFSLFTFLLLHFDDNIDQNIRLV